MKGGLIVALDCDGKASAERLLEALSPSVEIFKVGSALFTACGPAIIDVIHRKGLKVFLDLKLHDIPNTVARVSRLITKFGVYMFNLHALGGLEMMRRARISADEEARSSKKDSPIILGVTILTSIDEGALRTDLGSERGLEEEVLHLAGLAGEAGLDGVVASPKEARVIRQTMGRDFIIVTPGIRPAGRPGEDQKRVATPREAVDSGADYIVVGRPIIEAEDPLQAAQRIIEEMGD